MSFFSVSGASLWLGLKIITIFFIASFSVPSKRRVLLQGVLRRVRACLTVVVWVHLCRHSGLQQSGVSLCLTQVLRYRSYNYACEKVDLAISIQS